MRKTTWQRRRILGRLLCLLALLGLVLAGCAKVRTGGTVSVATPNFFGIAEALALQLKQNGKRSFSGNRQLLMTTVVDIDDLYRTCRFGRTLTEALANQLFQHGFGVVEVRKASHLMVKKGGGELILTRDTSLMVGEQRAEAVVVGTYSLTPDSVIVGLRMIDPETEEVLSVAGLEIQRSDAVNDLLYSDTGNGAAQLSGYER